MKFIREVITSIASPNQVNSHSISGLSNVKYLTICGFYLTGPSRTNASFLVPFMALPKVSTMKLERFGVYRLTLNAGLPASNLTSLVLVHSPVHPRALSSLFSQTPCLQRFVCIRNMPYRPDSNRYCIRHYLKVLSLHVKDSIQFVALDWPSGCDLSHLNDWTTDQSCKALKSFTNLRMLAIHPSGLLSPCSSSLREIEPTGADWSELLPMSLRTLFAQGIFSSPSNIRAMREFITNECSVSSQLQLLLLPDCRSTDWEIIIENVLLQEACTQIGLTIEIEEDNFRLHVAAAVNDRWKNYV